MKRLMVALSAVVLAAMLLWPAEAAAYDESAAHAAGPLSLRIDLEVASGPRPGCLRAIVAVGGLHARTIAISIDLGSESVVARPSSSVWSALCDSDDGLLWRAAAAIRRRAIARLTELILPRKTN